MTPLIINDQFGIIQNLHMFPIPQTSFWLGLFFAISYSKTALVVAKIYVTMLVGTALIRTMLVATVEIMLMGDPL